MSKGLAAVDRILAILVGLVCIALGGWWGALFFNEPHVQQWNDQFLGLGVHNAPEQNWFLAAVIVTGILFLILGLWLIIANLRPHRISRVRSPESNELGTVELNVASLAAAVADQLEALSGIDQVRHRVFVDRGQRTVEMTISAAPEADVSVLRHHIENAEDQFRNAVGNLDMATTWKLHMHPVR